MGIVAKGSAAAGLLALIAGITYGINQLSPKPPKIVFQHVLSSPNETIETDTFKIYEGGIGKKLEGVTCVAKDATTYDCEALVPPATAGVHFYSITVTDVNNLESTPSEPVEYRFDAVIKP